MALEALSEHLEMTLAEYITANLNRKFEWGSFDCVFFAVGWLNHATGKDYLAGLPEWNTEEEAERVIAKVGGLQAAIDAQLERIHPNLARDGHVTLHKRGMWLFSGPHIVGPGTNGLVFIDRTHAECAWFY